jgi:hypothetical protein
VQPQPRKNNNFEMSFKASSSSDVSEESIDDNSPQESLQVRLLRQWSSLLSNPLPYLKITASNLAVPITALVIHLGSSSTFDLLVGYTCSIVSLLYTMRRLAMFRKPGSSIFQLSHFPWQFAPALISLLLSSFLISLILIIISFSFVLLLPPIGKNCVCFEKRLCCFLLTTTTLLLVELKRPRGFALVSTMDVLIELKHGEDVAAAASGGGGKKKKTGASSLPASLSSPSVTLQHARIFYPAQAPSEEEPLDFEPTRYFGESVPQIRGLAGKISLLLLL